MKILILGSGGREHAIIWKLSSEIKNPTIFAIPGNGGISDLANIVNIPLRQKKEIVDFAQKEKINLTVVGPETPLSEGIVDLFLENGCPIFGPVKKAALLESSKSWAKEFMSASGIPTGGFEIFDDFSVAKDFIETKAKFPVVLKFDGLAAGKGVSIIYSIEEGIPFLENIFLKNIYKTENPKIILEEFLSGRELSYLIFTDGESFIPMEPAKDYKKIFDGDKGPNTGGMGCFSPVDFCTKEIKKIIENQIVIPTIKNLQKRNITYTGVLYCGIILTSDGPKVLEYNARFGDPETEVLLPRMKTPLLDVMEAVVKRELRKIKIAWHQEYCVDVVLASRGYPEKHQTGKQIFGLDNVPRDVFVFHSGTKKQNNEYYTSGGRVLNIVSIGQTITEAGERVYKTIPLIDFEGKYYRNDIALL
ncbi:MAG: phosphoribosylamine--glycine ligase [Candidatus Omnitrophica bacterium]|nr:phosphoribosylamine--glycine ligase [Candidatus Omnitrophota bacterium]